MSGPTEEPSQDKYLDLCTQLVRCNPLSLAQSSTSRDIETMKSRYQNEGLSFLTKTLPKLGKALDHGLSNLRFTTPGNFKSARGRSTPAFMQEYFNLIFDEAGELREDACPYAVKHLRQVLFFAYKLELPYSVEDEKVVIDGFIQTEEELELSQSIEVVHLLDEASWITSKVFKDFDPMDIVPRHGPGAVATGERLEQKWHFSRKYANIHRVYPYYDYFVVGRRELMDRLEWYKTLEPLDSGVAKVVLVPKDSRGPRLISCEPLEYQWLQQGLGRKLMAHLERGNTLTSGRVNFTHQKINQQLALASSTSHRYATLDLKDASDRVSMELVREVFKDTPRLLRSLEALRTTATKLPDGRILPLKKFAPMGSALCFPVEAYVFWVVMVAAICRKTRLPLKSVGKKIFVYGDDIVVPTDWALQCIQALESVGLKVNESKCCILGPFRESCGIDAFKGVVVTPIRLRKQWTNRRTDGSAYAAYVSLANSLERGGYASVASIVWDLLASTYGQVPYGVSESGFPAREVSDPAIAISRNEKIARRRWNADLQRFEFFVPKLRVRRRRTTLDSWPRMMRDLVSPPFDDPSEVVLPRSTILKRGWAPVR